MSNKLKVLIVGHESYKRAFNPEHFEVRFAWLEPMFRGRHSVKTYDLVCLTGGVDVNPELYGEDRHPTTGIDYGRDQSDLYFYRYAQDNKVPVVGICRGSQFLCAVNGGKLIQDVDNHAIHGTHEMVHYPIDGSTDCQRIQVTSTHHQMAYPWTIGVGDYEIVGWAESLSRRYDGCPDNVRDDIDKGIEPEVIHYNKTKCLGVQGHPEYVGYDHEFNKYFNRAVLHYLFGR